MKRPRKKLWISYRKILNLKVEDLESKHRFKVFTFCADKMR
ncbi:MAG: hypothetical protein ACOX4A_06305 [Saccharofermentanales bacterium]|jgi:hypothetical protein